MSTRLEIMRGTIASAQTFLSEKYEAKSDYQSLDDLLTRYDRKFGKDRTNDYYANAATEFFPKALEVVEQYPEDVKEELGAAFRSALRDYLLAQF